MVTSLAAVAPGDDEYGALMLAGGELTWHAGPIAKSAGLCHGTAGNGFAFLALFERTGDELLARARPRLRHARARAGRRGGRADGRGRYTLFTGDIGAALFAAACLEGDFALPRPRRLVARPRGPARGRRA